MADRSAEARPRRRFRWIHAGIAVLALSLCGAATLPVLSGRTESPRFSLEAAKRAVSEARRSQAGRWAPEALLSAEAAMRAALAEHRCQEVRFFLLRDFRVARESLRAVEEKARRATEQANRNREQAKAAAEQAIAAADEEVSNSDDYGDAIYLGVYNRVVLQKAKIALDEAKILANGGDYRSASDRAGSALTLARQVRDRAATVAARFSDARLVQGWRNMAAETIAWSRESGGSAIVVSKDKHRLTLYASGRAVRSYRVELGYNSTRDKLNAGDAATPEGRYRITAKKGPGSSTYYKALLLDYPNDEDRVQFESARRSGRLPRGARLGGLIEIHGEGGRGKDWTKGCLALSNHDIDDLFSRVSVGTRVTIIGGDGDGGSFTELLRRHPPTAGTGTR